MPTKYSEEFKREAIRLSEQDDRTCVGVAEELGLHVNTLYRWRSEAREHGDDAFPGKGNQTPEEAKIARLERRVNQLEQDKAILKKAMGIFADKDEERA